MKYVVCVPDGCADLPTELLGGRTPLEVADTPVLDSLAARGVVGLADVIPAGMAPGSDVGNMSIFGYNPIDFHTGRAPIEAAAAGLVLRDDQIAYRCNLVTVVDGIMASYNGGNPSVDVADEIIAALDAELGTDEVAFHPGVSYRHTLVVPATWMSAECTLPHDLIDKPVVMPAGPAAPQLIALMEASKAVVSRFASDANQIWLWGQGPQPAMANFAETYGVRAGLVTAVDLVRGLGVLTGIDVREAEGATAYFDTNYENKRDVALDGLAEGLDLFIVHVEASDEAGHEGNAAEKVRSLENWDSRILAGLVEGLDAMGDWRMLLLPDHATPLDLRTHTSDPVPYLLVDSRVEGPGGVYTEAGAALGDTHIGHDLMGMLLDS